MEVSNLFFNVSVSANASTSSLVACLQLLSETTALILPIRQPLLLAREAESFDIVQGGSLKEKQ